MPKIPVFEPHVGLVFLNFFNSGPRYLTLDECVQRRIRNILYLSMYDAHEISLIAQKAKKENNKYS